LLSVPPDVSTIPHTMICAFIYSRCQHSTSDHFSVLQFQPYVSTVPQTMILVFFSPDISTVPQIMILAFIFSRCQYSTSDHDTRFYFLQMLGQYLIPQSLPSVPADVSKVLQLGHSLPAVPSHVKLVSRVTIIYVFN
jgi:hypothetical protein